MADAKLDLPSPPNWAVRIAGTIVGVGFIFLALNWAFEPIQQFTEKVWESFSGTAKTLTKNSTQPQDKPELVKHWFDRQRNGESK